VYADQWGIFNGLNFSTYGVNPPNPTGYVPQMMVACMNDPGPIARTDPVTGRYVNAAGAFVATANLAQQITDPAYSPAYSNFCYETPFMPGQTQYMDTPVIPTQAFADGYNLPDSEYPDLTPAVSTVTGTASGGGAGPWVSAAGQTLTIRCLGYDNTANPLHQGRPNPAFSGPGATTAPFNQKSITRHYGFGSAGTVTIGGVTATCSTWSNSQLQCTVPAISATLNTTTGVGSTCYNGTSTTIPAGQTPPQRGGNGAVLATGLAAYRCGEGWSSRPASGKRSIDAVTVTVGGQAAELRQWRERGRQCAATGDQRGRPGRPDHRRPRHVPRECVDVEAGAPAGLGAGRDHDQRRCPSCGQAGRVAPASGLVCSVSRSTACRSAP